MRLLSDQINLKILSVTDLSSMRRSILKRIAIIDLGHGDRQEFLDILKLRLEEINSIISKKRFESIQKFFN